MREDYGESALLEIQLKDRISVLERKVEILTRQKNDLLAFINGITIQTHECVKANTERHLEGLLQKSDRN